MSFPPESDQQSGGYYLQNLVSIGQYLMANGYSRAAAAGVAGTIAGESAGNPESVGSGGAGLIGWTPPSSASPHSNIVTGNQQKDWEAQLEDLLAYADSNSQEAVARGGVDLSTLKTATDPQKAAEWWSAFEGPKNPGSDIRSEVVNQIYGALQSYKPNSGWKVPDMSGGSATTDASIFSFPGQITGFFSDANTFLNGLMWIVNPSSWLRIGAFLVGVALLLFAIHALVAVSSGSPIISTPSVVPVPV